jgi:hypothetical protein
MKHYRLVLVSGITLAVAAIIGMRSPAQTSKYNTAGDVAMERLERLTSELTSSKQTNTLEEVNGLLTAMNVLRDTRDAGMTAGILRVLRSGDTNGAIRLLELQLDASLIGLGAAPRDEIHEAQILTLETVKQYRTKYPQPKGDPDTDAEVARAFEVLEKK